MADSTALILGTDKKLRLVDNGDGTYSVAASLKGSLATLPSKRIDLIGTLNADGSITPGSQVVAAGATYATALQALLGYRYAVAIAKITAATYPTSWTIAIKGNSPTNFDVGLQSNTNTKGSAQPYQDTPVYTVLWRDTVVAVTNGDATNSMTIQYLGIGAE